MYSSHHTGYGVFLSIKMGLLLTNEVHFRCGLHLIIKAVKCYEFPKSVNKVDSDKKNYPLIRQLNL